jgi:hypothetical protein
MFSRFRTALGMALLMTLMISITAFAKGNFSFITITGSDLKEPIRSTAPALTTDFFAFADFTQSLTAAPANPGVGYEITRYYIDSGTESAFDKLHYYPDTGFVYFDGLVGGSSDYDGKWYTAQTGIKEAFIKALPAATITKSQPVEKEAEQVRPNTANVQNQTKRLTAQPLLTVSIIALAGFVILAVVVRRRKVSV